MRFVARSSGRIGATGASPATRLSPAGRLPTWSPRRLHIRRLGGKLSHCDRGRWHLRRQPPGCEPVRVGPGHRHGWPVPQGTWGRGPGASPDGRTVSPGQPPCRVSGVVGSVARRRGGQGAPLADTGSPPLRSIACGEHLPDRSRSAKASRGRDAVRLTGCQPARDNSSERTPFQTICTPTQSRMKAERRVTITAPVRPSLRRTASACEYTR